MTELERTLKETLLSLQQELQQTQNQPANQNQSAEANSAKAENILTNLHNEIIIKNYQK